MSTVLVTGAGGFVGSAVVRRLVAEGGTLWDGREIDHVVAVVRPHGSLERLESVGAGTAWSVERVDLDESSTRELIAKRRPRAVVHTALDAAVHEAPQSHEPLEALLDSLESLGDARIVHAGSAWVLGPGTHLAEDAPLDPKTAYARHKIAQDRLLAGGRVPWINLRLFNVFGRYEKPWRLVPSLVEHLYRGDPVDVSHGVQVRDFNDVDDIAGAFALALGAADDAWSSLYHIGSGRSTSARELAGMVAEITGHAELIRYGAGTTEDQDLPALTSDPTRAARKLGWRVDATLEERVRSAVEWWLERLDSGVVHHPVEESIR